MTVAVAHQVSPTSAKALEEAAREASFRGTRLAVIHVVQNLDEDVAALVEAGTITGVSGIGKATAQVIEEIVRTGESR